MVYINGGILSFVAGIALPLNTNIGLPWKIEGLQYTQYRRCHLNPICLRIASGSSKSWYLVGFSTFSPIAMKSYPNS